MKTYHVEVRISTEEPGVVCLHVYEVAAHSPAEARGLVVHLFHDGAKSGITIGAAREMPSQ